MHFYPNVFLAQCHDREECMSSLLNLNPNLPLIICALLFCGMCAHISVTKNRSNMSHCAAMAVTTVMSLNDGTFQLHYDLKC